MFVLTIIFIASLLSISLMLLILIITIRNTFNKYKNLYLLKDRIEYELKIRNYKVYNDKDVLMVQNLFSNKILNHYDDARMAKDNSVNIRKRINEAEKSLDNDSLDNQELHKQSKEAFNKFLFLDRKLDNSLEKFYKKIDFKRFVYPKLKIRLQNRFYRLLMKFKKSINHE